VHITTDSFSDGGKFYQPEEAVRRIKNLIGEGADIIDIGAESTRPGATPLNWRVEWARLEPVLRLLSGSVPISVPISIDTYHPETAERALALGAKIINCVYEHPVLDMLKICQKNGAELIFPAKTLGSVPTELLGSVPTYIDPMIGFGTTREEDVELLKSLPQLARRGRVLVGASRKRIVKKLVGVKTPGKDIAGNLAVAVFAAMNGASAVRVHDVKETVQALRVLKALQ
jgi:dihydropteroate synthase